jgi:pimeloyl-ACP methyl ester carboxylesterase
MPGYGGSPPLAPLSFAGLAAAAIAVRDAEGGKRGVLIGHSLGGMIALEAAIAHPERVVALVLFATTAAFGGGDGSFRRAFLAERLAPLERGLTPADIAPQLLAQMLVPGAPAAAVERATASMAAIPTAAYRAALECIVTFDRRADLPRLACPTLVIAAELDRLAPPRTMERMAAAIPHAVYRLLQDAGHLANLERADSFHAALEDFLAPLDAAGNR